MAWHSRLSPRSFGSSVSLKKTKTTKAMSMPKNSKTRRFCATYTLFILCVLPFLIFADEKLNCSPGLHDFTDTTLQAPPNFTVTWKTTADSEDNIVIEVIREWSPLGADRFYQLVLDNFFNCATFFRVVPGKNSSVVFYYCQPTLCEEP